MNKITKGALTGGAAVALLLGAGGTLAYWNAEAELGGAVISTGQLNLEGETGSWTLNGDPVTNVDDVVLVPGDSLAFTGGYTIAAAGDNLEATLEVTGGAQSGAADDLDITQAYTLDGAALPEDKVITAKDDGALIGVSIDIELPAGAENASQDASVTLDDVTVSLEQVAAEAEEPAPEGP